GRAPCFGASTVTGVERVLNVYAEDRQDVERGASREPRRQLRKGAKVVEATAGSDRGRGSRTCALRQECSFEEIQRGHGAEGCDGMLHESVRPLLSTRQREVFLGREPHGLAESTPMGIDLVGFPVMP